MSLILVVRVTPVSRHEPQLPVSHSMKFHLSSLSGMHPNYNVKETGELFSSLQQHSEALKKQRGTKRDRDVRLHVLDLS